LDKPAFVEIKVYDILGEIVTTLVNTYKVEGIHGVDFAPNTTSNAVYHYFVNIGGRVINGKMILIK
jgi:hypothetical protein